MVRITEEETTDIDGRTIKVRKIEAAHARLERPDGTVEEYSDINAEEWPWSLPESAPEWRVFGIPMPSILLNRPAAEISITLLMENGEIILKLGSISIGMQMSYGAGTYLFGNEVPLQEDH